MLTHPTKLSDGFDDMLGALEKDSGILPARDPS